MPHCLWVAASHASKSTWDTLPKTGAPLTNVKESLSENGKICQEHLLDWLDLKQLASVTPLQSGTEVTSLEQIGQACICRAPQCQNCIQSASCLIVSSARCQALCESLSLEAE